jgi:hypothetical protein
MKSWWIPRGGAGLGLFRRAGPRAIERRLSFAVCFRVYLVRDQEKEHGVARLHLVAMR